MNSNEFIIDNKVIDSLKNIASGYSKLPTLNVKDFDKENTLIIHVDIVNGFAKFGALSSEYVLDIIGNVVELNEKTLNYDKVFILDSHEKDAEEFKTFPPHCVVGTKEDELVDELIKYTKGNKVVRKNSTNAMHVEEIVHTIDNNKYYNFIVVGDVTDICVMQFALALKTYKNEKNIESRVVVPYSMIDTFDNEPLNHNRMLMNIFGIYNMIQGGIEVVSDIL